MKTWELKDVAEHWDKVPGYDKINSGIDSYYRRFTDTSPLFRIPSGARVLDVDCRTAKGTVFFKSKYPDSIFTCVAMSNNFQKLARERLNENNIESEVHVLESIPLNFSENTFDVILSFETLEHMPHPYQYVKDLSRILKSEGTLVLTTPNLLWEPVHLFSELFKIDHGEGPHRMLPRQEILEIFADNHLEIIKERTYVLIPLGPRLLIKFGKWLESKLPISVLKTLCLRRTFICKKLG